MRNFLKKLFNKNERELARIQKIVEEINNLEDNFKKLSDEEMRAMTDKFRERLNNGEELDSLLPEAFALVREAAVRVLEQRHFDVQLVGGIVLHEGKIAEMKTGEGKTLVSTLSAYLNALKGHVHIVTVNDYLAERDSKWMGEVHRFLGLSVGLIKSGMMPTDKKVAYSCDITYGTNNEFGFDYLRDNMEVSRDDCVQGKLQFAIIDEVDSILIDEARTPLILSGMPKKSSHLYYKFDGITRQLSNEKHFTVDEKHRNVTPTEEGIKKVESLLNIDNLYSTENYDYSHYLSQALKAHHLFRRDKDYVVKDDEVIIVDDFTGRLMFGRRYSEGLHQAIEAKERVKIKDESQTLATITLQNFFLMYEKLSGMTGTAKTEEREFIDIYNMEVIVLPTNRPLARIDSPDVIYKTKMEKYEMICERIIGLHKTGQPVLVGTISIEVSELIADLLKKKGVACNVLNAKYHEQEAAIISEAGKHGAITIATNMAGRGTDIVLDDEAKEAGGLFVLGTERHESRRIDNQLRGRSGRQGDPGHSEFILSLEDDLLRLFGSDKIRMLYEKFNVPQYEPIAHPLLSQALERAQKRVETQNYKIRKHVLEYDNVINDQRSIIYKQRREVIENEDLSDTIREFIEDVIPLYAYTYVNNQYTSENWDIVKLQEELERNLGIEISKDIIQKDSAEEAAQSILEEAFRYYNKKTEFYGEEFMRRLEKVALLRSVDDEWREYLVSIDSLREGIGLRAYGQKDPLVEYKIETHAMFDGLIARIKEETVKFLFKVEIAREREVEVEKVEAHENRSDDSGSKNAPVVREGKKIGRNEPCPCGSGKKYKRCCGR
ncbi:MAG: preprotein translocase subunit SecA [Candidatus Muiribacterium halophilum]|uniref:Protein translocase subunit SecA n=1 Tax=Muiribacterium halophilum TaxID=2053465 RepID=A0A2N5ZED4_MUIH1|nr:MAG: preprotein translocase subunit SecA [Candidatus Muirbacterium halophilum]